MKKNATSHKIEKGQNLEEMVGSGLDDIEINKKSIMQGYNPAAENGDPSNKKSSSGDKNTGPKKESKKSRIITAAFFVFSLVVVAVIAIIEFGGNRDRHLDSMNFNLWFFVAALGCFFIGLVTETVKYALMLKEKGVKDSFSIGLSCAVIGKYYDNLTPAGAGGQGFQMYHLKKNGCDDGTSGSLPIVGFLGLQFAFVFIGIITMIFGSRFISDELLAIKITAIIGMIFYAFVPMCIIFFAVAPNLLEKIVSAVTHLLARIKIIKDADKTEEKVFASLRSYTDALRNFGKNYKLIILVFVLSLIYQLAFMSLPFFVLHLFGSNINFLTCFCRVVYIYAAITIIFTPGNSGAAEASFYMVFNSLSGGAVFWGMLVWRVLCYYGWIICGAICQLRQGFLDRENKAWHKLPCEKGSAGIFVDTFYPHIDGVVTTVNAYASHIKGSYVVCPGDCRMPIPLCDYGIAWIKAFGASAFKFGAPVPAVSGKAKRYIRNHRVSVFHAHSPFPVGWMALKYGRRYNVPVIATFHSKYYDDFYNVTHSKWFSRMLIKCIVIPFYERADEVWACSKTTAVTLKEYGYTGTVKVMENGTDMIMPNDHEKIRKDTRSMLHISQDKKVITFVGQMVWHKNIKLVIDTIRKLRDRGFDYELLIAGEGYDGKAIREYVSSCEMGKEVRFLGRIDDRDDLKKLYLASDLFFFPSKYDNAPITLREAAALEVCGLLLAGSNAAEVIEDGVNGFVGPDDPNAMADIIIDIFKGDKQKTAGINARTSIPVMWDDICVTVKERYIDLAERWSS